MTTLWAFAMYVVVLTMGSVIFGLMLALFMERVGWTGGYAIATLASIIAGLAALLLALLQVWDLVQIARYREVLVVAPPMTRGLGDWWWAGITLFLLAGGFVVGRLFWA